MRQRSPTSAGVLIEAHDSLPDEVAHLVAAGHAAYEMAHDVACAYAPFAMIARDASTAPVGVASGYCAFLEIYIDDLWVAEAHRCKGIGRTLLKAVEDRFRLDRFDNINLVTNAFQAVGFYLRCGFEIEFQRENRVDPKLSKTFLIKRLA